MSKKVWNLFYVAGNPALHTRITKDSGSPLSREQALEDAAKVAENGWRVWVERVDRPERIFESYHEIAYRTGQAPGTAPDSSSPGAASGVTPAPVVNLQVQVQLAAVRWWEHHRPVKYTLAQHLDNPGINTSTEAQRQLAVAVGALVKASIK